MPLNPVGWGRAMAIAVVCLTLSRMASSMTNLPEASSSSINALISLDFCVQAPEISKLIRSDFSDAEKTSKIQLSYYHPIIQEILYSQGHAGPSGLLHLPDDRIMYSEQIFTISVAGEHRRLIPDEQHVQVTLSVFPGKISEQWEWPDGLVLKRTYFENRDAEGTGMVCVIHNRSGHPLSGLRLGVQLIEPEITIWQNEKQDDESDDELFADPRNAVLFQRDYLLREENWLAYCWNLDGGLITAGENIEHVFKAEGQDGNYGGLAVNIETPAKDLEPGQLFSAVFYQTRGIDRETVVSNLRLLRKNNGFHQWETENQNYAQRGMRVSTASPEIDFYFQTLKTWAGWLVHKDKYGTSYLKAINPSPTITPENMLYGLNGLMALGEWSHPAIEGYLDEWIDQRAETEDIALILMIVSRYYFFKKDGKWLRNNKHRIMELVKYYLEMDRDQDGLPEYHLPRDMKEKYYSALPTDSALQEKPLYFLKQSVITLCALNEVSEVLMAINESQANDLVEICMEKYKVCEENFEHLFWYPDMGNGGYYSYAVLLSNKFKVPVWSVDQFRVVADNIGSAERRNIVFNEIWGEEEWRDQFERYRMIIPGQTDFSASTQSEPVYAITQEILKLGLKRIKTHDQAEQRLNDYMDGIIYQSDILGLPWGLDQKKSGMYIENLNFIDLLLQGVCGLEPVEEGLRIHIMRHNQYYPLKIEGISFRKGKIDLVIINKGRHSEILCDGKIIKDGEIIPNWKISGKNIKIKIVNKIDKKKQSDLKKVMKTNVKKKRK